jgi:hypothetical protein
MGSVSSRDQSQTSYLRWGEERSRAKTNLVSTGSNHGPRFGGGFFWGGALGLSPPAQVCREKNSRRCDDYIGFSYAKRGRVGTPFQKGLQLAIRVGELPRRRLTDSRAIA